jgi:hypothetical protein
MIGADALHGTSGFRTALAERPAWMRWGLYYAGFASILLFGMIYSEQSFIYFRF